IVKEALANGRLAGAGSLASGGAPADGRLAGAGSLASGGASADGRLAGAENLASGGVSADSRGTGAGSLASGGAPADAVALAAALHQPWATVVLSGAVTGDQLASNLRAQTLTVDPARWQGLAVPSAGYWQERSQLPWS
ncbi:aldo/keto reductase, partial [Actinoplanes sp. NPDC048791]